MGSCCGKSAQGKNSRKSDKPNQNPIRAEVPKQADQNRPTQKESEKKPNSDTDDRILCNIFNPIPFSRKVTYHNSKTNNSHELTTSVPYDFKEGMAICRLDNSSFIFAGGFENKFRDELSATCMKFEGKTLSGRKLENLPEPAAYQSLVYDYKNRNVYAIGGVQRKNIQEDYDEGCEFEAGTFSSYDVEIGVWEILPSMKHKVCCPTCFIDAEHGIIYAMGGFTLSSGGKLMHHDYFQCYSIEKMKWEVLDLKFTAPVYGALASPLMGSEVLIVGGLADLSHPSTRAFIFDGGNFINIETPPVGSDYFIPPVYDIKNQLYFLTNSDKVVKFNIENRKWSVIALKKSVPKEGNFPLDESLLPRSDGLYVYHADLVNKKLCEYNIMSQLMTTTQLKLIQYQDAGIAVLPNGKLLFAGGCVEDDRGVTDECFLYDSITGKEESFSKLPHPQRGVKLLVLGQYVFGLAGYNPTHSLAFTNYSQYLDLETQQWGMLKDMQRPVRYPATAYLNNTLYVIGGEQAADSVSEELTNIIQTYNLKSHEWSFIQTKYPLPIKNSGVITISDTSVLIFGGEDEEGDPVTQCFSFDGSNLTETHSLNTDSTVSTFYDPACLNSDFSFIFTSFGNLWRLDMESLTWSELDVEESVSNQI